jgi:aspartyl/asparaginyl beta-hydroxylase (cupin superfamily)
LKKIDDSGAVYCSNEYRVKDKNDKFYSKHTIIPIYGYKKWSKYSKDFPITVELIKTMKSIETCCFLKLAKNARLDKHYGYNPSSNYILRNHLGLIVPQNCGMWVDNEIKMHVEGEWLTFDDSKLHTAFNNSGADRYILLIDLCRPDFIKIGNSLRPESSNDDLINEFILENADGSVN